MGRRLAAACGGVPPPGSTALAGGPRNGHPYLTLVYQIDTVKRLLWVAEERTEKSLRGFFESLSTEVKAGIQFVASDMWKPYLKVIAERIPAALMIRSSPEAKAFREKILLGARCS